MDWYRWGRPLAEQKGEYLTYEHYCTVCTEEGITPCGLQRFRSLMTALGIWIAPRDEHAAFKRDACFTTYPEADDDEWEGPWPGEDRWE